MLQYDCVRLTAVLRKQDGRTAAQLCLVATVIDIKVSNNREKEARFITSYFYEKQLREGNSAALILTIALLNPIRLAVPFSVSPHCPLFEFFNICQGWDFAFKKYLVTP